MIALICENTKRILEDTKADGGKRNATCCRVQNNKARQPPRLKCLSRLVSTPIINYQTSS